MHSHGNADASQRFRAIRLSQLSEEEIKNNDPNPELYERAEKLALGRADAFVSHSCACFALPTPRAQGAALPSRPPAPLPLPARAMRCGRVRRACLPPAPPT